MKCKVAWHSEFSCGKFKKLKKKKKKAEDGMLADLAKRKKWRRCPKCKYHVEKSVGYFYIKCRSVSLSNGSGYLLLLLVDYCICLLLCSGTHFLFLFLICVIDLSFSVNILNVIMQDQYHIDFLIHYYARSIFNMTLIELVICCPDGPLGGLPQVSNGRPINLHRVTKYQGGVGHACYVNRTMVFFL